MAINDTIQVELKLGRIWLEDSQGLKADYEREEIRDSLLTSSDDNGLISEQNTPNWFKETKLGFAGADGHPKFPVKISSLDYSGSVDSDKELHSSDVSLNRGLSWQEYVALGKKKSIIAEVSYTLQ